jgi:hypothetical protein
MNRLHLLLLLLISVSSLSSAADQGPALTVPVKSRFSKSVNDHRLVDKDAFLILDNTIRKLIVRTELHPLDVDYDAVQRIIFDVSTRMRGGAMAEVVGGLAGTAIASKHVSHYWCYIETRLPDGTMQPYMIEIPQDWSPKVIQKMQEIFGDKVTVADFPEHEQMIEKSTLKDLQSKHDDRVDTKSHPLPEIKPDKALVVVVCPPTAARAQGMGFQLKLHANDQVIAVNRQGTYSFAYLDPGDYLLATQTENASGFQMKLEAGKDYYFFQDIFMGAWKARTRLSRHTKELVMYEVQGAYFSDWKRK